MPLVEIPDKQMVVEFPNTMTAGEIEKAILADVYGQKEAPAKDSFDMGISTDARRAERVQEPELSPPISTITNKPIPTAEEKFRQSDFITSSPATAAGITASIPTGIAAGYVGLLRLASTGDLDKAKAMMDEINAQPAKFIKTPEQQKVVENISKAFMYLPEKGKEVMGKIADAELKRLSPEDQKKLGAIKPIMETAGEFGVLAAFPLLKKAVGKSTWYRMLSNEERGLVVQSLDDVLKNNPNMTEGEILRKWDNPNFKREALAKRMKTEQETPLPEAQATPQATSKPTGLPISDLQKAIAKQAISETLAQNGLTPETFMQIANRTESLARKSSLETLPSEASAESSETSGQAPEVKPAVEDVKTEVSKVKDGNLKDAKIANEFNDSIAWENKDAVRFEIAAPETNTNPSELWEAGIRHRGWAQESKKFKTKQEAEKWLNDYDLSKINKDSWGPGEQFFREMFGEDFKQKVRVTPDNESKVKEAIVDARKNGMSNEFRSLFGGIKPEVAGTTPEAVSALAKKLNIKYDIPANKPEFVPFPEAVKKQKQGEGKYEIGDVYWWEHPDPNFKEYSREVIVAGKEVDGKIPVYSFTKKGIKTAGLPPESAIPELTPKSELSVKPEAKEPWQDTNKWNVDYTPTEEEIKYKMAGGDFFDEPVSREQAIKEIKESNDFRQKEQTVKEYEPPTKSAFLTKENVDEISNILEAAKSGKLSTWQAEQMIYKNLPLPPEEAQGSGMMGDIYSGSILKNLGFYFAEYLKEHGGPVPGSNYFKEHPEMWDKMIAGFRENPTKIIRDIHEDIKTRIGEDEVTEKMFKDLYLSKTKDYSDSFVYEIPLDDYIKMAPITGVSKDRQIIRDEHGARMLHKMKVMEAYKEGKTIPDENLEHYGLKKKAQFKTIQGGKPEMKPEGKAEAAISLTESKVDKPTSPDAPKQEIASGEGTGKGDDTGLSKLAETEAVKEQKGEVGLDINQEPEAKTSFAPEIEEAYQSAKGVKQEGIVSKIKEIATEISNKFTRTYESLAESGENSQLIFDLKKLEKQKEVAADKTVRTVGEVLSELNPQEYDVFSRKLFLDDLYDDYKRELYQDKDMPFNFTDKSLIAEKKKIDSLANKNPKVLAAIEKRKAAWEQVKTEYVSALKPYKEGVEDMFRENYYRHQVLDYVANQGIFGTGKRIKAPVNKGYTKGRKGVSNLYNTDFFEAEHNIMAQMLYDIEVAKTLTGIKKIEDISDKLKAEAKKQNIEDWRSLIPEGYIEWQPREGQVFYPVMSVNEKLAEKLATDQIENLVGPEIAAQLKQVLAVGGKRKQWIVREEVADTLNNLVKDRGEGIVSQADLQIMSSWKKWQLISPRRAFKYNLRNLSGDAEATFLGNPQGFKKAGQATKELYEVFYGKKPMTPEMESWFNRGGMGSTLQAQEMDQVKKLWIFKRLYKKDADINIFKKAWDTVRLATDFRESILRYANFLSFKEQLAKNGKVKNYGASNPEMIDALSDPDDKAFWLSNDLLGAYDKVSVAGQTIRERMIPFWSWQEVNFKRYVRLFKNAANDGKLTSAIGKKLGSKGLLTAMRIGRFALKAAAFAAMLQAWNYLFFKKEEEELPRDVRTRTHIILGKDKDGNINYFNRLGTLDDFVSWFGLDFVPKNTVDLMNGRQTWQEAAKDQATKTYQAPINKVVQGSAPFMKLAGELITRRSTFPDTFKPGTVRDRGLHVARSVGLENEYIAMTGKPSKGYGESLKNLFVYRIDPGEAAYRNTIDLKMSFMKKQGKVSEGFWLTPSGDTLYNMKLAVRYNDKEAFGKYLKEYIALNQGKSLSDIAKKASDGIKRMHPLNELNSNEQTAFIATSNKEDKKTIEKAIKFYYDVLSKMGTQEKKP